MVITVKVEGKKELDRYLKNVRKDIKKAKPYFTSSSLIMLRDVDKHFREGKGPLRGWSPLKIRNGKPLQKTGRLKNSFIPQADNKNAVVGTNLVYARLQNNGGIVRPKKSKNLYIPLTRKGMRKSAGSPIPKNLKRGVDYILAKKAKIPARPFMYLSNKGANDILNVFIKLFEQ
jgi:phage gpG-like protein